MPSARAPAPTLRNSAAYLSEAWAGTAAARARPSATETRTRPKGRAVKRCDMRFSPRAGVRGSGRSNNSNRLICMVSTPRAAPLGPRLVLCYPGRARGGPRVSLRVSPGAAARGAQRVELARVQGPGLPRRQVAERERPELDARERGQPQPYRFAHAAYLALAALGD